ncbi:hypothetical protein ACGFOU_25060 [Streptomyces sp. NPDC048595]|uniref:hypothetical protein n=1 Tax=Streptomyces sp. NPDC048595 TaxID=3365576 RepID=UPI003714E53A
MRRLIALPTVLFALAAAGCADAQDGGAGTAVPSSAGTGAGPGPDDPGVPSPAVPGQPVSCGTIKDALGAAGDVALYADPGAGGTVGCTEARDVMKEFLLRAPREGDSDQGTLAVRGWFCQYESGPTGTWITSCRKDRREMHTEEPAGSPDSPGSSQLPTLPEEPSDPLEEPSTEEL